MIAICPGLKTPKKPWNMTTAAPYFTVGMRFRRWHVVPIISTHSSVCSFQNNYILVSSVTEYLPSSAVKNFKRAAVFFLGSGALVQCPPVNSILPLMSTKMWACARDFCKSLTDTLEFWLVELSALDIFTERRPRGRPATALTLFADSLSDSRIKNIRALRDLCAAVSSFTQGSELNPKSSKVQFTPGWEMHAQVSTSD